MESAEAKPRLRRLAPLSAPGHWNRGGGLAFHGLEAIVNRVRVRQILAAEAAYWDKRDNNRGEGNADGPLSHVAKTRETDARRTRIQDLPV